MSSTKLYQRVIAGMGALLFLVTASAFTIMVIWDSVRPKDPAQSSATDTTTSQAKTPEEQLAGKPLADFTPITSVPELEKIDTLVGPGEEVQPGATVTVDYTGAVAATGTVFQSSLDSGQPVKFSLNGVIPGWTEGIPGMKVGGTRRLIIPAAKAYGDSPPAGSNIPVNADLVFDVTLISIDK